jgi:hypothetical protein
LCREPGIEVSTRDVATRPPPRIRYSKLPKGVQDAGALRIERQQARGTIIDVLHVPESTWKEAHYRYLRIKQLAQHPGPLGEQIEQLGYWFRVSSRTV